MRLQSPHYPASVQTKNFEDLKSVSVTKTSAFDSFLQHIPLFQTKCQELRFFLVKPSLLPNHSNHLIQ